MSIRPLLLVAALAGGDYLLWSLTSNGSSPTVALVCGIALVPLILAFIWLLAVAITRSVLIRAARPQSRRRARQHRAARRSVRWGAAYATRSSRRQRRLLRTAGPSEPWQHEDELVDPARRHPRSRSEQIAA